MSKFSVKHSGIVMYSHQALFLSRVTLIKYRKKIAVLLKAHISEAIAKWKLLRMFLCPPIVKWGPLNFLQGLRKMHFCWQIFSYFRNIQYLFWLECKIWAKVSWAVVIWKHANVYDKRAVQGVTLSFSISSFFQI